MPETFEDMLVAARAENTPAEGTPEPETPASPTSETAPADQDPAEGQPSKAEVEEKPFNWDDLTAKNPELVPLAKQLQADYTKKTQEAAELRKQFEGIDTQAIETIRQLNTLAQENPAQVAEYFRKQAELFDGMGQGPAAADAEADALADYIPQTDAEAVLLNEVKALKEWRLQQEQVTKQTRLQQEAQQVSRDLDAIEKQYGVTIPEADRVKAWDVSIRSGLSVDKVWFAQNQEAVLPKLIQKAKDEASSIVQTKAAGAAGNPAPLAGRAAPSDEQPSDFAGFLQAARQEIATKGKAF